MSSLKQVGPGIVMAATGLGAGDMIAATIAGANYGAALLWAAVLGAILKFTLNEGLARWQLSTGSSVLEGWFTHLPRFIHYYFFAYLILWSFIVAGAIMVACGIAAHSLFPSISIAAWGIIHSLIAAVLVISGHYTRFETLMKLLIGFMFLVVITCAVQLEISWQETLSGLFVPSIPDGSITFIFGIIGGVGGSVTVMCYGYWMREHQWNDASHLAISRVDLLTGYALTAIFAIAIMLIASTTNPEVVQGVKIAVVMADQLELTLGTTARWLFLLGFWAAVFSSMLGVWQGIPYLFADAYYLRNKSVSPSSREALTKTKPYRLFLLFIALPPLILLFAAKPVWIVIIYAVAGAFFMPFLAGLLLYMNNQKRWVKDLNNGLASNTLLFLSLLLFLVLFILEIQKRLLS